MVVACVQQARTLRGARYINSAPPHNRTLALYSQRCHQQQQQQQPQSERNLLMVCSNAMKNNDSVCKTTHHHHHQPVYSRAMLLLQRLRRSREARTTGHIVAHSRLICCRGEESEPTEYNEHKRARPVRHGISVWNHDHKHTCCTHTKCPRQQACSRIYLCTRANDPLFHNEFEACTFSNVCCAGFYLRLHRHIVCQMHFSIDSIHQKETYSHSRASFHILEHRLLGLIETIF